MGVEPEEIEHVLRGKRTLPRPGEEPVEAAREEPPAKRSSASPEADPGAVAEAGQEQRGPGGQLFTEDEERRFQLRGGRFNAASRKGGDRV